MFYLVYSSESVETALAQIDDKLDQVTMHVLENQITLESAQLLHIHYFQKIL